MKLYTRLRKFAKDNILLILLIGFTFGVLLVNLRINIFRYNNFDFGKFDLGNMTQMLWNTMHGRILYLTDYFGTNLPRWSMSHVDPILLLFVIPFALYQHPLTLVVSQLILVLFSSILIYKIALLKLNSKVAAVLLGLSYLFYPAVGFLTAWTGFHGVTAVMPFFLGAFYVFEKMYQENSFTKKGLTIFWILLVLTMMGKEQIPLYIFFYGIFIWLFRGMKKLGISMMAVGFLWFALAFFVIIPQFAHYRVDGYQKFAESLGLNTSLTHDVARPNYFLSRYEEFGETYTEVMVNMALQPTKVAKVFFGGDKLDNLNRTFAPLGYLPFVSPAILVIALPDFLINYLTTQGGIGTSEIYNHRVSMIVPVLFISVIFAIDFLAKNDFTQKRLKKHTKSIVIALSLIVLGLNIHTTYKYNNPVYLWLTQAVEKRVVNRLAFAKTDLETAQKTDLKIGDVLTLTALDDKDRECAQKVTALIPDSASVSGPDYLGAHLSMRETYAIFPALYKEADYVIVDVFSRKILTILDADVSLVRDVVADIVGDPNYELNAGCGNLFVFKKVGVHPKTTVLPLQEKFEYEEKFDYEIFQSLTVVDYTLPESLPRGESKKARIVYIRRDNNSLDGYFMFITFVNEKTGEIYQAANLASFGLTQLNDWVEDHYYIENMELAVPTFVDPGEYRVFIGMSNKSRTRSMYLGNVEVL